MQTYTPYTLRKVTHSSASDHHSDRHMAIVCYILLLHWVTLLFDLTFAVPIR